jgi:hypothetical protein
MCQAGFSANADGNCHSPAARFQFKVAVTGGLLVNPTGGLPAWCVQPSCFINNPIDRLDQSLQLGIDVTSANISGTLASGALNGYASATAGPLARVAGLSPTTTTLTFEQVAPYTYNGSPFTARAVATATDGLHVNVPVVYTGDCTHVTAGGCTATATYHGDSTHEGSAASQTITIAPRPITFRADDVTRTYGETTPAFSYSVTAGTAFGGDTFGTPVFTAAINAGSHALELSGLSNPDYAVTFAPGTLTVTRRDLLVTAIGDDKVYDGNTSATVTLGDNRMPTDKFTTSYESASFADKHVGTEKNIQVTGINISGADAGNYNFNTTFPTNTAFPVTADITPKTLTPAITASDKTYDGTSAATISCTLTGVIGTDVVTCSGTGAFDTAAVGTGKTVTSSNLVLGGALAGNYALSASTATATANITAATLTPAITASNKTYDGTAAAAIACTLTGAIGTDVVTCSGTGTFDTAAVCAPQTV